MHYLITTGADNITFIPRIENFHEVTTVSESAHNLVVFSFDFLNDLNISIDHNSDNAVFQLRWETANKSSSGLIPLTVSRTRGFIQTNYTTAGAVTYNFTVAATAFGEGPLLLTLSTRLQCIRYTSSYCNLYRRSWCTCSAWQYGGESETILINAKKGNHIHIMCIYLICRCFTVCHNMLAIRKFCESPTK